MLLEDKELPELFNIKHRFDDNKNHVDYGSKLLSGSLSPYIYKNDMMNGFLTRLQKMVVILFDQQNIIKNLKNYIVDKYEYRNAR